MPSMAALVCHQSLLHFHISSRNLIQNYCPSRSLSFSKQFICPLNPSSISQKSVAHRIPSRVTSINPRKFRVFSVAQRETVELKERNSSDGFWSSVPQTFMASVAEAVSSIHKPAMVALLFCLLVTQTPELAFAASGGRVGGSSFPKASQSRTAPSRPAPSQSYSRPSRPIISSPSPIYTYETEYITTIPLTAPAPTYYGAPAAGLNVGSGGAFFLVFMGCAAMQAVNGFISERSMKGSLLAGSQTSSVLKLQVGLLGMARTLQRDLEKIADNADTTTTEGLHYILTEACLAMLRHPDFCTSALSSYSMHFITFMFSLATWKSYIKRAVNETEEQFNQLSLEERGKFDEETLVNVNSLRKRIMAASKGSRFSNEFIVVTILVAMEGEQKLPIINCSEDLTDALHKLGSLPADSIQAVEVLWTPQDENDTLSERDLLRKYPLLRSL